MQVDAEAERVVRGYIGAHILKLVLPIQPRLRKG